jgi:hypothetical protein
MPHVVLLGDSIFDNARYTAGGLSVIDHMRRALPAGSKGTLLARDGAIASDVIRQAEQLPEDATHLVISGGGNDALASNIILQETTSSLAEALHRLADLHDEFRDDYRRMLQKVLGYGRPVAVCTVYDLIPTLSRSDATGLCLFNDVILREAFRVGIPVLDLRLICTDRDDYSKASPIEPSAVGGGKIARAISRLIERHDFRTEGSRAFA